MIFFVGLHMVNHAHHFDHAFISVNRLRQRKSNFEVNNWILDSGAFTEISKYGGYRHSVREYATLIDRWFPVGNCYRAVSQDWMCEPHILRVTGKTVVQHQKLTVSRYKELKQMTSHPIMPVLQGFETEDYLRCLDLYGMDIAHNSWVGVGSVCKRNGDPEKILEILSAIHQHRPGLFLHGFGIKLTALGCCGVRQALFSSDSMAWSRAAFMEGRGKDANSWEEAKRYETKVNQLLI